jgi:hypothetical protein
MDQRGVDGLKQLVLTSPLRWLETLYNASLSFVDVHVVRTGGSNNFFFELWWIQEGWMV